MLNKFLFKLEIDGLYISFLFLHLNISLIIQMKQMEETTPRYHLVQFRGSLTYMLVQLSQLILCLLMASFITSSLIYLQLILLSTLAFDLVFIRRLFQNPLSFSFLLDAICFLILWTTFFKLQQYNPFIELLCLQSIMTASYLLQSIRLFWRLRETCTNYSLNQEIANANLNATIEVSVAPTDYQEAKITGGRLKNCASGSIGASDAIDATGTD